MLRESNFNFAGCCNEAVLYILDEEFLFPGSELFHQTVTRSEVGNSEQ
jgi:hypothetical protein